ncbi:MAG: AIPR family protein, partial [Gemmataceae bacterium]
MSTAVPSNNSKILRFAVDKDHYRRIEVESGVTICHLYPTLAAWIGRETPDDVNPRSHEDPALTGAVPKAIEQTLKDNPTDFYLANRGETILAQSVTFDPEHQRVEIVMTDHSGDDARHGVADGGTTDAVIARVQREAASAFNIDYRNLTHDQIPQY